MSARPASPPWDGGAGSDAASLPSRLSPRRRGHRRAPTFGAALGLTVLGALVPGSAFLAAGRRLLGGLTLAVFVLLLAGGAWAATAGRQTAARTLVDTSTLMWLVAGLGVLGLLWAVVVVAGYRMLVPARTSRNRRLLGGLLVAVIILAGAAPAAYAANIALVSRDLIAGVFDDGRSATVVDVPDPFGDKERVNVLLLGGDGGEGRDGVRTDTVIVASIDTDSGETTLFSLPRNLENLPFPADSPLAQVYPDGFEAGAESESLLNAVYRNGPAAHPDILGPTDDPGADFLKLGVGEALGLTIDYYVLVNLDGFSRLVDALGGITVNVNYWVPVGGDPGTGALPNDYIEPGPNREMDGFTALSFARGRFNLTDYDRMARQRCTINAIIQAADPVTLLQQYQEIAETTQDIVSTDIPSRALDDFVDLAFLVKDANVRSVVFDTNLIDPAYPDYDLIRSVVDDALAAPTPDDGAPDTTAPSTSAEQTTEPAEPVETGEPTQPAEDPLADVADACAYDPVQAEEELARGKPPTANG
jgi:LCP family protein required for cell wall assembly